MDKRSRCLKEESGMDAYDKSDSMTLTQIARYLEISEETILKMVRSDEIPGVKDAEEWRFLRPLIDDWLSSRMQTTPDENLINVIRTAEHIIPLSHLVSRDHVIMDLKPGTGESVLRQLVQPLADQDIVENPEDFLEQLLDRESLASTGIAEGVAIPHARNPETSGVRETCIVLGICTEGTDFGALIGGETYVFCLLCSNSLVVHLRLAAKVTLMFRADSMVEQLRSAVNAQDVLQILMDVDTALAMSF